MTPTEYRAAIESLGLSQVGASRFFGVDPRTSRRWALGELAIPRTVELCLRIMIARNVSAAEASAILQESANSQ